MEIPHHWVNIMNLAIRMRQKRVYRMLFTCFPQTYRNHGTTKRWTNGTFKLVMLLPLSWRLFLVLLGRIELLIAVNAISTTTFMRSARYRTVENSVAPFVCTTWFLLTGANKNVLFCGHKNLSLAPAVRREQNNLIQNWAVATSDKAISQL